MLVCWSGGFDSTLVLLDLLKAREKTNSLASDRITTLSICNDQVPQSARQKLSRDAIYEMLPEKPTRIEINMTDSRINEAHFGQAGLWLSLGMLNLRKSEDLYFGYIKEDEIWHGWHHFQQAFASLRAVHQFEGSLITPLEWVTKAEVIIRLQKHNSDYLTACWCCEGDNFKPCNQCTPCRKLARAMGDMEFELERLKQQQ